MVASYRRRRLWGITEESLDAFDELVDAVMSPGVGDDGRLRGLFTQVLDDLVGPDDAAGHALIQASPMRFGFANEAAARAWIVDLLASAARQQESQWWAGWDDDGYPRIHGGPFRRLRDRTGLARAVLDRRIQLMFSQQTVADACGVVQGEVQSWEAGMRIPSQTELDRLADVLGVDRDALARAETGSAVFRNELSGDQQAELDARYWGSDEEVPGLAARFGLEGRSIHKLVTALAAGIECDRCGAEMVFTARGRRACRFADCPSCRRAGYFGRGGSLSEGAEPR